MNREREQTLSLCSWMTKIISIYESNPTKTRRVSSVFDYLTIPYVVWVFTYDFGHWRDVLLKHVWFGHKMRGRMSKWVKTKHFCFGDLISLYESNSTKTIRVSICSDYLITPYVIKTLTYDFGHWRVMVWHIWFGHNINDLKAKREPKLNEALNFHFV